MTKLEFELILSIHNKQKGFEDYAIPYSPYSNSIKIAKTRENSVGEGRVYGLSDIMFFETYDKAAEYIVGA